jgi:chromosome segregation ATPase
MFEFLKEKANSLQSIIKKGNTKNKLDKKVLKKNNISLLILDERWNSLFKSTERTPEIIASEEKLKELLKLQSRLMIESKEISGHKKDKMDKIIQLTTEVFDRDNEEAKKEMSFCEKEINQINKRLSAIEEELDNIPNRIKEANLELLEGTVNIVYYKIRFNQKRIKELESLIDDAKARLKEYIDEKGALTEDDTDIYSYFHDLLGGEELEKLDREFFG